MIAHIFSTKLTSDSQKESTETFRIFFLGFEDSLKKIEDDIMSTFHEFIPLMLHPGSTHQLREGKVVYPIYRALICTIPSGILSMFSSKKRPETGCKGIPFIDPPFRGLALTANSRGSLQAGGGNFRGPNVVVSANISTKSMKTWKM